MSGELTSADVDALENFVQTGSAQRAPYVDDIDGLIDFRQRVVDGCGDRWVEMESLPGFSDLLSLMHDNEMYVQEIATTLRNGSFESTEAADGSVVVTGDVGSEVDRRFMGEGNGAIEIDQAEIQGLPPTSGYADDPICTANGNFVHGDHDLGFPGVASALDVVRYYNSLAAAGGDAGAGRPSVFGRGWSSLLDMAVVHNPDAGAGTARVRLGDGAVVPFVRRADGSWRRSGRRRALHLTELTDADGDADGWELTDGKRHTWVFDATGCLVGGGFDGAHVVVERGDHRVAVWELTSGRSLVYRLNERGLVARARASDGREVGYRYDDADNCVAAVRAQGDVRYEIADGLVAAIHDADDVLVCKNTYDNAGRVLTQLSPFGRSTRYDYTDLADGVVRVVDDTDGSANRYVHDRRGNLTAVTDAAGGTMTLAYDRCDRLVKVTDRAGAMTSYRHDIVADPATPTTDRLLARVDPDGGIQRWDYDRSGRVVSETDRAGGIHRYSYHDDAVVDPSVVIGPEEAELTVVRDERGLPVEVIDGDGVVTRYMYDTDGQLAARIDGAGGRTVFSHDRAGRLVRVTNPAGVSASFDYDDRGRLATVHAADGATERYTYSRAGRILACQTDGPGSWSATYGPHGKAVTFTDAAGASVVFGYDRCGYLDTVTAPDGAVHRYEYSPTGQIATAVDPAGGRTEQTFDPEDRPVSLRLPGGETWTRQLDPLGRTMAVTGPDGSVTEYGYHPNGEIASTRNPLGETVATELDRLGNTTAEVGPDGSRTTYAYTPGGRLATVTTPAGRTWRYHHDNAGRLASLTDPDDRVTRLSYRLDGNIETIVGDDGGVDAVALEYWYDHVGRPTSHLTRAGTDGDGGDETVRHGSVTTWSGPGRAGTSAVPGDRAATFDWDERGLLAGVTDPAGIRTSITRDVRGRPIGVETGTQSSSIAYGPAGDMTTTVDPIGRTSRHTHSPSGLLETTEFGASGIGSRRTYDGGGSLTAIDDLAGGALVGLDHDPAGRLRSALNQLGTWTLSRDHHGLLVGLASPLGRTGVDRDADGLVTAQTNRLGTVSYERTPGGQLDGFRLDDGSIVAPPEAEHPIDTDRAGRITADRHGRAFGYDTAGRLASATGPDGFSYEATYNDYGLLATDTTPAGRRIYRYDAANQLVETIDSGVGGEGSVPAGSTSYTYDDAGRRCGEIRPDGTSVAYRWNDLDHLTEITVTGPDGTSAIRSIDHGPLGRPELIDGEAVITWDDALTAKPVGIGDTRYLRHGTQTLRVNADEAPDGDWDDNTSGDPWGHDPNSSGVRIGYRGELAVDEWVFMGDRVYHPATRCFLTTDPLPPVPGQNALASPYVYAWCDPINHLDPTGRQPIGLEAYEEIRSREEGSRFGRAITAFTEDPWGSLAVAGLVIAGGVLCFTPLAPVGAGILLGVGASTAMGLATDNVDPRAIAVSGVIGGASGGAGALLSNAGAGLGSTIALGATSGGVESIGVQVFAEGTSLGDINWTRVATDSTVGGVGAGVGHTVFSRQGTTTPRPEPGAVNSVGGTHNCVSCAISGDLTLGGSPASALNLYPGRPIPNGNAAIADYAGAPWRPIAGQAAIDGELLAAGNGARGIVYGTDGRVAHVWNAVVQRGRVNYVDFQGIGPSGPAAFDAWNRFSFIRTN